MAEVDHSALEAVKDEMEHIAELTYKADLELALKRNELMAPIFKKRQDVIAKIPKFWPTIFQNQRSLSQLFEEYDLPVLEYLDAIDVKYDPKDSRNYEIIFTFKENPHFSNKELIKKVSHKGDDESVSEVFEIDWKDGKDITLKDPSLKRKKGKDDKNRTDSFFSWFGDEDSSLAELFAHEIFPQAMALYVEGDDEDFEDDDDEGSIDLNDDDDEEEDDEVEEPTKKKNKK
ncbi:hypothetical protein EDD11_003856 [Mortierella claussenii]|nr:hypothetical protein EDD11_003856 [Mortierella claussenii]